VVLGICAPIACFIGAFLSMRAGNPTAINGVIGANRRRDRDAASSSPRRAQTAERTGGAMSDADQKYGQKLAAGAVVPTPLSEPPHPPPPSGGYATGGPVTSGHAWIDPERRQPCGYLWRNPRDGSETMIDPGEVWMVYIDDGERLIPLASSRPAPIDLSWVTTEPAEPRNRTLLVLETVKAIAALMLIGTIAAIGIALLLKAGAR
jgi:hypothetical protein